MENKQTNDPNTHTMAASDHRDTSEQNVQTTRVVLWEHEWPLLRRFSNCLVKIVGEMNETVDVRYVIIIIANCVCVCVAQSLNHLHFPSLQQQREKTFSTLEETRESFAKTTISNVSTYFIVILFLN